MMTHYHSKTYRGAHNAPPERGNMELKHNDRGIYLFFPFTSQGLAALERVMSCLGSYHVWDIREQIGEALKIMAEKLKEKR